MLTPKQRKAGAWPKRLKAIRSRHSLTQRQAAEKIGAAVRTWIGWENGRTPGPAFQRLIDMAFGK